MKFFTILIVFFFYRNWFDDNPTHKFVSFDKYQAWFMSLNIAPYFRYCLCVGLPSILILVLSVQFSGLLFGFFSLALSLLVLVFAIEIHNTGVLVDEHVNWLRSVTAEDALADVVQRQEDFIVTHTYERFQSIIPVLFWFLFTGPGGALFYSLSARYIDTLDDEDPEVDMIEEVVFWLEWMPTRITSLLFTFVGNFGPGFDYWVIYIFDIKESHAAHLAQVAGIAVEDSVEEIDDDVLGFAKFAEHHIHDLRILCDRALYGWLGLAALVTIIGW